MGIRLVVSPSSLFWDTVLLVRLPHPLTYCHSSLPYPFDSFHPKRLNSSRIASFIFYLPRDASFWILNWIKKRFKVSLSLCCKFLLENSYFFIDPHFYERRARNLSRRGFDTWDTTKGTRPIVHPLTRGKQSATVSLRLLIGFPSFRRPWKVGVGRVAWHGESGHGWKRETSVVRIDSTGYSTSSKRGSYSESPIMLGSIGDCELSIPIQESLLRVCVYIYLYIRACRCLGTSCVQQSPASTVHCYFNRHRHASPNGFPVYFDQFTGR